MYKLIWRELAFLCLTFSSRNMLYPNISCFPVDFYSVLSKGYNSIYNVHCYYKIFLYNFRKTRKI